MRQLNYIKTETSVPFEAAYGWGPTAREWGGFLADVVAVPWADHMLCPLPEGVDPIAAAGVADNVTDAWRSVGPPLRERPRRFARGHKTDTSGRTHAVTAGTEPLDESGRFAGQTCAGRVRP
jgi:hypothetical protein